MAPAPLRVSAPQSPYRDCDIALLVSEDPTVPSKVICADAASGLIVGSTSISPGRDEINADEVIRMIGGTYRLAAIAVEIGTDELAKQTRRISDELRLRRRLWRRRRRQR
jgi:hypothetical protein